MSDIPNPPGPEASGSVPFTHPQTQGSTSGGSAESLSAAHQPSGGTDPLEATQRREGATTLRRGQVPEETTDQRLLDRRTGRDWAQSDPWRVLRIQAEFVEGFDSLATLGKAISVFGSARTPPGSPEYAIGRAVGRELVEAGYAVITGGGPGAMEAVNRGAQEAGGVSVGLGIELPFEQRMNHWVDIGINFRYFFCA